ncbi:hypothetical protein OK016_23245 [Vibrio chagasii]|nr:hypothetical protein [Vibrio chagasii]
MDELADWGNAQRYYLFVIDENNRPLHTDTCIHTSNLN